MSGEMSNTNTLSRCHNFGPHSHFGCSLPKNHEGPHYNPSLGEAWEPIDEPCSCEHPNCVAFLYWKIEDAKPPPKVPEHKGNDSILAKREWPVGTEVRVKDDCRAYGGTEHGPLSSHCGDVGYVGKMLPHQEGYYDVCLYTLIGEFIGSFNYDEIEKIGGDLRYLPMEKKTCPDGGACHHSCGELCWRVRTCEPLSNVFPDDRWPADITEEHTSLAQLEEDYPEVFGK